MDLEVNIEKEVEVTEVEAVNTEETPIEATEVVDGDSASEEPAPEVEPVEPAYEPNFKYKVNDEEREFDERLKSIIKTKEDEEWLREAMGKAEAFDSVKERKNERIAKGVERYEALESEYKKLNSSVEPIINMLDKKDYANVFQVLGIEKDEIIKHAYDLLQYQELTPEQKSQYDKQRQITTSHYELERQNQDLNAQIEQIGLQQRQSELTSALSNPEISSIVAQFDQKNGQNAFYREVANRGALYETSQGIDKAPQELVTEIINLYGLSAQAANTPPTQQQTNFNTNQGKPPVIPNTGASGQGSPVKKKIRSLDELRALGKRFSD